MIDGPPELMRHTVYLYKHACRYDKVLPCQPLQQVSDVRDVPTTTLPGEHATLGQFPCDCAQAAVPCRADGGDYGRKIGSMLGCVGGHRLVQRGTALPCLQQGSGTVWIAQLDATGPGDSERLLGAP